MSNYLTRLESSTALSPPWEALQNAERLNRRRALYEAIKAHRIALLHLEGANRARDRAQEEIHRVRHRIRTAPDDDEILGRLNLELQAAEELLADLVAVAAGSAAQENRAHERVHSLSERWLAA